MASAALRLIWFLALTGAVVLGSLSVPSVTVAQEIAGLRGSAANAVEAQIRSKNLRFPRVSIFYGDLTGRGTNDAISFVYHDSGGSAEQLTTWIWHETDGAYALIRTVTIDEIFGIDPRNVVFSPGGITVTMTVPRSNDPHCCPTGERRFALESGIGNTVATSPSSAARKTGNWIATARTAPAMVEVTGTATDGRVTFSGGCNPLMGRGFTGSLYGYGGEALQRIDDQSEAVTFEVAGRNGAQSFAGEMHYFAPDEAWVITGLLPVGFLDAFARGDTLTIRNGVGEITVVFELSGSSRAVQTMRQVCGT